MYWNLVDDEGYPATPRNIIPVDCIVPGVGMDTPMKLHGTRDYIDGVIFGIQLMGGPKFIPKLVEKEEATAHT